MLSRRATPSLYPTPEHARAAQAVVELFSALPETEAVLRPAGRTGQPPALS
jgi:hypothetical protein